MRTTPDMSTLTLVRRLARRVKRLEEEAESNGRGQQASLRSLHEGAFTVYDDTDAPRLKLGKQDDGSYGVRHTGGSPPSIPSTPVVQAIFGGAMIQWDGFDANGDAYDNGEVDHVRIHLLLTADDVPDDDNLAGTIVSHAGGALTVAQDAAVTTYAVLVAVNKADLESGPSASTQVRAAQIRWEDDDPYTLFNADLTARSFSRTLKHKGIAADHSVLCFINGVRVPASRVTLTDAAAGVVTVALDPAVAWETTTERVNFHYAYTTPDVAPHVQGFTVFSNEWDTGSYTLTGLQAGDLVVFAPRHSTTPEERFSLVHDFGSHAGTLGPYSAKVWTAPIDRNTANMVLTGPGVVLRFRANDGTAMRLDTTRKTSIDNQAGNSGSIPALPGKGSGAVAVMLTIGGIGGGYGTTSWAAPFTGVDTSDGAGDSYGLVYAAYTALEDVPAVPAPQHDSADTWWGMTVGIAYGGN